MQTTANRYEALEASGPDPEDFVRRALALLESDFRELALSALSSWEQTGLVSKELFGAVAALQRPSWGTWNGLLASLRNARKAALRTASGGERDRVSAAAELNGVLSALEESADAMGLPDLGCRRETMKCTSLGRVRTFAE